MSDTPRTDDVVMQAVAQGMRLAPVAELARELERENAALREDKARLVKTANEVLESLILHLRVEANHPCPENLVICRELQAAIDTAQKEAQP